MKKLLPQANSLDVLIETFKYCVEHPIYTKDDLAKHIGYQPRQVDYYLNACYYLDILDVTGRPTDYSLQLYSLGEQLRLGIYERILNDSLIGKKNAFPHRQTGCSTKPCGAKSTILPSPIRSPQKTLPAAKA